MEAVRGGDLGLRRGGAEHQGGEEDEHGKKELHGWVVLWLRVWSCLFDRPAVLFLPL